MKAETASPGVRGEGSKSNLVFGKVYLTVLEDRLFLLWVLVVIETPGQPSLEADRPIAAVAN